MIIWSGWGILALLMGMAGAAGGTALGLLISESQTSATLGVSVGLAAAAVGIWFVGRKLNRPVDGFHPRTGEPVKLANRHRLFFVPMQYWAPPVGVGALVLAIVTVAG